jgi:regulatory subunit for Cdc7p protein kinase
MDKALEYGLKIWDVKKLDSVLERTLPPDERQDASHVARGTRSRPPDLGSLLAAEKLNRTSERDQTQKRHDFRYFSKNSYFVLIEDIRQELATIGVVEYPVSKEKDGIENGAWPVLHCHPNARGPFIEYDEREHRRWQRQEEMYHQREMEKQKAKARYLASVRRKQARIQAQQDGRPNELRRTVSLSSLWREDSLADITTADGDAAAAFESAHASGYLASGTYVAASGNSVSVASTTGTTSTIGSLSGRQLPPSLRDKLQHEVVTKRKVAVADGDAPTRNESMGPPAAIPDRRVTLLRKSRSTNTLRLPKRQEGTKPGFCESCRVKFEDFAYVREVFARDRVLSHVYLIQHVQSKKHRKFATDPANFLQLDTVLARVRRRTLAETAAERAQWESGDDTYHLSERVDDDTLYDEDAAGEDTIDLDD